MTKRIMCTVHSASKLIMFKSLVNVPGLAKYVFCRLSIAQPACSMLFNSLKYCLWCPPVENSFDCGILRSSVEEFGAVFCNLTNYCS